MWTAYRAAIGAEPAGVEPAGVEPAGAEPVGTGCARCRTHTSVMVPIRGAVSGRFTAYRSWTNMTGARLCAACAWAYRTPQLRRMAHRITRRPDTITAVSAAELFAALCDPIDADTAFTVPTAGRKHLLPDAQWGRIYVDETAVSFTADDRRSLVAMARLRGAGFSEPALFASEPSYRVLAIVPHERWEDIFDDWMTLDLWRAADPWWQIGIRATRHIRTERERTA